MALFWKLIIASAIVVAVAWAVYGIWEYRQNKLEKEQPRERSDRYQQATGSVADYAKKLAEFKKPTYKREDSEQPKPPPQG